MVAVWGQHLGGWDVARASSTRASFAGGWRLSVLHRRTALQRARGPRPPPVSTSPTAAIDRSGAPVARGATFQAAAAGDGSDGRSRKGGAGAAFGVGEREYRAYLRGYAGWVVAVPWVRRRCPSSAFRSPASRCGARSRSQRGGTVAGHCGAWDAAAHRSPDVCEPSPLRPHARPAAAARAVCCRGSGRGQQQPGRGSSSARALSQPLAVAGIDQQLPWLVRDMGATVALYRDGRLVRCSRPDLVAARGGALARPRGGVRARRARAGASPLVLGD